MGSELIHLGCETFPCTFDDVLEVGEWLYNLIVGLCDAINVATVIFSRLIVLER
jgi:hypothetical protein